MPTTYPVAVNDMFSLINSAWKTGSAAIAGYVPELRFQGIELQGAIPTDKYWARVSQQGVSEEQSSICNDVTAPGNRRYTADGLLYVQLFGPQSVVNSMEKLRLLAKLARNAYRGKVSQNDVSFYNVRIVELESEGLFFRINVIAEYQYDEIG